jgi:hypothetical protein
VYTEALTLLRAVMMDSFFNRWCFEIPSDNRIRHVRGCVYKYAQNWNFKESEKCDKRVNTKMWECLKEMFVVRFEDFTSRFLVTLMK